MHLVRHKKRQDTTLVTGESTAAAAATTASGLILASGGSSILNTAPPLASSFTPTITSTISTQATDVTTSSPAATSNSAALKGSSSVAVSTVVAACVGSFVGLALLICVFIWWSRHPSTKTRNLPRSPVAENRNARGREEQGRVRSQVWDKLDDEGGKWAGPSSPPTRQMSQQEMDEKNFPMFKKRSPSTRTTRTTKALEEHGFDMPPISQYHPSLAKELALEQPERPFAQRQESGISWDGETLGDDSFLSLRSVRIESGSMSPTMGMAAKMTPPAMPSSHQLHHWQSAEVLTVEESANPFADSSEERRKSRSNPFFNANEVHRSSSRRSRSNSRGHSHSRNASRTSRNIVRSRVVSEAGSQIDPFADLHGVPEPTIPEIVSHQHNPSVASGESAESSRAMQSLIAALDMSQVHRQSLRVSMPPSTASRYSGSFLEPEDDIGVARDHPPTPTTPTDHR